MAKVILICGHIYCGKNIYAKKLASRGGAVILSCDEAVRALIPGQLSGGEHDLVLRNIKGYLLKKSSDIAKAGCDVILDWGFWSAQERLNTADYLKRKGVEVEWHYIDMSEAERAKVAQDHPADDEFGYLNDDFRSNRSILPFEEPDRGEIDVWTVYKRD